VNRVRSALSVDDLMVEDQRGHSRDVDIFACKDARGDSGPGQFLPEGHSVIRIGVLGTARVVPYGLLAPAKETQGVEVTAIASRTQEKAEEFAARHGIQHRFGSYQALLESKVIDAVYIALPTALHYEWGRRALEAGKHVLCEKPLAENAQLAQDLFQLAGRRSLVLVEAMHILGLEKLRRQRELVAGAELGRLLHIESCFRTPYVPFRKGDFRLSYDLGGGAALDVGCYAVSCLRYVAAEEPEVLTVSHRCTRPQIDRWMRATVRFSSGVDGVIEFGFRGFYLPRDGVVATCEKGRIKWDGKGLVLEKQGKEIREPLRQPSTYQRQLESFAKRVRGEKSDDPPPDDAVLTARVLDTLYREAGLALRGTRKAS
jgi:predicted dehydrogenase